MLRWQPGHKLQNDRFIIETILGGGGYGVTYRARDTLMDRTVAIKTLDPTHRNQPDFDLEQEKFVDEAKRLARCDRPNIVRVWDIFPDDRDKLWCMVMECISGQNLQEIVDDLYRLDRTLSQTEALSYIRQVGSALTAVHELGMLHRDVKPLNILREQQTNRIVLIDFGLAREFELAKTRSMTNAKTIGYAPPEQYDRSGKFTPALDVYALAATLYTLLTGAVPIDAQYRKDYPLKTPQQLKPDIPAELSAAIMRGMEMAASNRPQSVVEFLALLEPVSKSSTPKSKYPHQTFTFNTAKLEVINGLFGKKVNIIKQSKQAEYIAEDLGNGIKLEMVYIPAGSFMMGSPAGEGNDNEKPQHLVNVPAFYMGKYPITQSQYLAIVGKNPSKWQGGDLPVDRVSWLDAQEFCQKLTKKTGKLYRLPSEAEWEYACRAGTKTPFHFGETITTNVANFNGKYTYGYKYNNIPTDVYVKGISLEKTTPVGSYKVANEFGLYDLHGNVWEWCLDEWVDNYNVTLTDGSAQGNTISQDKNKLRPLRGGSWNNNHYDCRSACRRRLSAVNRDNNIAGFRVVFSQDY